MEHLHDAAFGHSVFQGVLRDDPQYKDGVIDPATSVHYENDGADGATDDLNHKPDHQAEEMIVGTPENGNGGLVVLPKGHGGAPNYPSVWAPGTWGPAARRQELPGRGEAEGGAGPLQPKAAHNKAGLPSEFAYLGSTAASGSHSWMVTRASAVSSLMSASMARVMSKRSSHGFGNVV